MSEERKVHVDERRLTCAVSKESVYCLSGRNDSSVEKAIVKLGQLEDLEDELGVPLLTIAKALKDGIWTLQDDFYDTLVDEPSFVEGKYLEIGFADYQEYEKNDEDDFYLSLVVEEKGALCLYTHEYEMKYFVNRLKDYGRTWALAKGELEK